jgi:hypothetical protein
MGITAAGKEWLRKWELWVESDVGQETITKNLNGLAKLMGVPESDRERFCFETWFWIGYATIGPVLSLQKGYAKDVILQDAELKIRAAHKAVERLCSAKKKYQDFNFGSDIEPKGLEECERVLSNLVAAFSVMTNSAPNPLPDSGPGSRDLKKNWMFEKFVAVLFIKSAHAGRRRLTFSHHNGTGTMLEAIRLLAPLLPPGFVPAAPINNIRRAKKIAEEWARWDKEWEKEDREKKGREKKGKKFFLVAKAWVKMQEEWERREREKKGKGFTN